MTPLRDDLLAALRTEGPMTASDAGASVGTSAKIAMVALHAMREAGVVRLTKSRRSRSTGRLALAFEAVA